jgi:two-component system, cell cycle response regulator
MSRPPLVGAQPVDGVWNRPLTSSEGVWTRPVSPRRDRPSSWATTRIRVVFFCQDRIESLLVLSIMDQSPGVANITVSVIEDLPEIVRIYEERKCDILLAYVKGHEAISAVRRIHQECPTLPIVLLSDAEDERTAVRAVQAGAQDFLLKEELTGSLLLRALRYAVERNRLQLELRSLSLTDELTGLHNRRGFFTLAMQVWRQAVRLGRSMVLFYFDVDGLKIVNDQLGHAEGDCLLAAASEILRLTFRESDVLSRLGGDEFVVMSMEDEADYVESIAVRLTNNIAHWNRLHPDNAPVSLSYGVTICDPASGRTLESFLAEADAALYRRKRLRREQTPEGKATTSEPAPMVGLA